MCIFVEILLLVVEICIKCLLPYTSCRHKGVVTNMIEGSSALYVHLDDGRSRILELGKQGVRLIPQKQNRSKT